MKPKALGGNLRRGLAAWDLLWGRLGCFHCPTEELDMQEVDTKSLMREVSSRADASRSQLETSERIVRITVITAFVAVLTAEAWLLWQVFQLL